MGRYSAKGLHLDIHKLPEDQLVKRYGRCQVDMARAMANEDIGGMVAALSVPRKGNELLFSNPVYLLRFPKRHPALDDPRVATAAVRNDPLNLRFLKHHRLCDRKVLVHSLRTQPWCIFSIHQDLETVDGFKELAIGAVQSKNQFSLLLVSAAINDDLAENREALLNTLNKREVAIEAAKTNGLSALRFAKREHQEDLQIVLCAVKTKNWHDVRGTQLLCKPGHGRDAMIISYQPLFDLDFNPQSSCTGKGKMHLLSEKATQMICNDSYLMGWLTLSKRGHRNRRAREALLRSAWNLARLRLQAKVDLWLINNEQPDLISAKRRKLFHL